MSHKNVHLENVPLFAGLAQEHLELLAAMLSRRFYPAGEVLFPQGGRAIHLFIVLKGLVSIRFKPHDGEVIPVAEIKKDGVFGWSAALGHRNYSSSAVCIEDSEVLCIRGADLQTLCTAHPETGVVILERLAGVIAERLNNTHQHVIDLLWEGVKAKQG